MWDDIFLCCVSPRAHCDLNTWMTKWAVIVLDYLLRFCLVFVISILFMLSRYYLSVKTCVLFERRKRANGLRYSKLQQCCTRIIFYSKFCRLTSPVVGLWASCEHRQPPARQILLSSAPEEQPRTERWGNFFIPFESTPFYFISLSSLSVYVPPQYFPIFFALFQAASLIVHVL